jgi:hypothetical protein
MADDPFARLAAQREREHAELERITTAVGQAALADTMAGLWAHVLGVRTVLVAASDKPNSDGIELVAKRLWSQALERWVRPVAVWSWRKQGNTDSAALDRLWIALSERMGWTIDLVVNAVGAALTHISRDTPDAQRSYVAELLSLDGITLSLWEQIHELEEDLQDPSVGRTDSDAAFARRVRLQADLFQAEASRARSKGFAAMATVDSERADEWRQLARTSNRPPSQVRNAENKLARHDERLFHDPAMDPGKLARLQAKLFKLNGEARHGHESWRNSITRDARAVATGLLNASTLQYGIGQAQATGQEWIKRWQATLTDTRTRPTHLKANGQVVPILDEFHVGAGLLDHPADFDAPPEEFWNCRCSMIVMSRADHDAIAEALPETMVAATIGETVTVPAAEPADTELSDMPPLMWHGVITLEETYTGDRRFFRKDAIRTQALPLPIRFQREDWGGHSGAVVVANAEGVRRYGNEIRAWGTFADGTLTPEVEEVVGLMATRMIRGISIDGDDVLDSQFELEVDAQANAYEMYDSMRLRGATMCAIPAFDGTETTLGPPPPEWLLEGEPVLVQQNQPEGGTRPLDEISDEELEAMLAASRVPENLAEYWTVGEGAAKVRWGTTGDFNRCRELLAQYVTPGQLSGMCANLHHRALGVWPGQEAALTTPYLLASVDTDISVADLEALWKFTRQQFDPRELGELTPVTIDDEGNVFGHIAGWATCHQAFSDMCVTPPRSQTNYTLFHTGAVRLDDGTDLPIGKLTVGAGHANPNGLGVRGATAHYDNSALAVAMVRATEDRFGIQVSGVVIPGTPEDKIQELRRSPISGDWRTYRGNLELVAALGVNSPGFPIPRTLVASLEGRQVSLVAAGYVPRDLDGEAEALAARMHAPLVASLAIRMEPTSAELDTRAAKLAARMATLTTED